MDIFFNCPCGRQLKAAEQFAGSRAKCPYCNSDVQVPKLPSPSPYGGVSPFGRLAEEPILATEVPEFLDPPQQPAEKPAPKKNRVSYRQMFEALLDPRSIQWMLTLGGGLALLGVVIWLGSMGIFKNVRVVAAAFGGATALLIALGWWLVLKTRFRAAGRALTMLGCLVAPLNLWFYHVQGLLTLDNHLWVGGLICCLLYVATVYVLHDGLFVFAVEGGVTMTVLLFLAELQRASDSRFLSVVLLILAVLSIHAERAFPAEAPVFDRRRFGLPLFWSGQVQLAFGLLILLSSQAIAWWLGNHGNTIAAEGESALLMDSHLFLGGLWLIGAYLYLYSDLVVRRVGFYVYLAALCVVLGAVSLMGLDVRQEWIIAVLAVMGAACNLGQSTSSKEDKFSRALPQLGLVLCTLPVLMGLWIHVRATSQSVSAAWPAQFDWQFVATMLVVAVTNRLSAWLARKSRHTTQYLLNAAAAIVVAAAGGLRLYGLTEWSAQAPWLMLIPIAYLLAEKAWRGRGPAQALGWIAHVCTAVILLGVVLSANEGGSLDMYLAPQHGQTANLLLGIVFLEATVFYLLAAWIRRRSANIYLAAVAASGALWQFFGYANLPSAYYTLIYAGLGLLVLLASRVAGITQQKVFHKTGEPGIAIEGPGRAVFQVGNGLLSVALLAAFLQGLSRLVIHQTDWNYVGVLSLTIFAGVLGGFLAIGPWRRFYPAASLALVSLDFLMLNVLVNLSGPQKLEIFCLATGAVLLVLGYIGRFREETGRLDPGVTLTLWLGGLLSTLPLLIDVIYHRAPNHTLAPISELGLFVVSLVLLVTGLSWQIKATTFSGGVALVVYLIMVIVSLGWRTQIAAGVYLTVGGLLLFGCGVLLSIYRERLLALPERIARREGLFRVLDWR